MLCDPSQAGQRLSSLSVTGAATHGCLPCTRPSPEYSWTSPHNPSPELWGRGDQDSRCHLTKEHRAPHEVFLPKPKCDSNPASARSDHMGGLQGTEEHVKHTLRMQSPNSSLRESLWDKPPSFSNKYISGKKIKGK